MKTLALAALSTLVLAQTACAAPTPAVPTRILVTLQTAEVSNENIAGQSAEVSTKDIAAADGPGQKPDVYAFLLKNKGGNMTEISVETPSDFPGVARYSQNVAFMVKEKGESVMDIATAPTSLEATPHLNADGTIDVKLKMEVTQVTPRGADVDTLTTTLTKTSISHTFKSGDTFLVGGGALPQHKHLFMFVTVTVLPAETAAHSPQTMP